jgi:hypothetical protein
MFGGTAARVLYHLRLLGRDEGGSAAIEFAVFGLLLVYMMLNVVDLARYAFERMQVENAAQMGVQSIWKFCDPAKQLPASTQCPDFTHESCAEYKPWVQGYITGQLPY